MKEDELTRCGLSCSTPLTALFKTKAYRLFTFSIVGIEILGTLALAVSPLMQKILIDGVNSFDRLQTIRGLVFVAGLTGISLICKTGSYLLRVRLCVEVRCLIKASVFRCLLGLPDSFLKEKGSGYFFNRLQTDSTEIVTFYSGDALLQFANLMSFVFALIVMSVLNWKCALLILPLLAMQYILYRLYRKKQYKLGHRIQECTASERYRMQEYLSGHTTLKTHNAVDQASEKLEHGFLHWKKLAFSRLSNENRFRFFLFLPYYATCGGITIYGLEQILLHHWTLGGLWALLMLIRQVFTPAQKLASIHFQMQQVQAAWMRLQQICHSRDREDGLETDCTLDGDIVFSHVGFSYDKNKPLFRDLDFTVKAKELFFLTGDNGTGKTTVFQLLLRLYDPSSGNIFINGKNIKKYSLTHYRARIGYLGQTPDFFPGTIRENVLVNTVHSDEKIMDVFRMLKSEELVLSRTGGLDSIITERGQNFSGGERLRIALVRELLRDTDILLLDEPSASLDHHARQDFYRLLQQLRGQRTILAITHDPMGPKSSFDLNDMK